MSLREEQCNKVCRILDDVLANRPTERDSLIVATRSAFSALSKHSTNLASLGTDCISRQQAIDALERAKQNIRHNIERAIGRAICEILDEVENGIKQLPPIQPKRGKWIKTARWGRVYYCDQCRNYLDFDGVNAGRGSTNFCPNCGAKMRDKDE